MQLKVGWKAFNIKKRPPNSSEIKLIELTLFIGQTSKSFPPKRMPFLNVMTFSERV